MVIKVSPTSRPKVLVAHLSLNSSCGRLRSLLKAFHYVVGFILSKSFQWYWWCRHWSFGMLRGSFFLSLLSHSCNFLNDMRERKKKARKKERNLIDTLKLQWQHYQYYIKDLDKTNQTTPKKPWKVTILGHTSHLKVRRTHLALNSSCDPLSHYRWPFMVLLDSSHRNLYDGIDNVITRFQCVHGVYFFLSSLVYHLSFLFIVFNVKLFYIWNSC
jgi:hypothetical protein